MSSEADRAAEKKRGIILITRRRAKVLEFYNKGMTQAEMAAELGVDQSTVSRDIRTLSKEARKDMSEFFGKRVHL